MGKVTIVINTERLECLVTALENRIEYCKRSGFKFKPRSSFGQFWNKELVTARIIKEELLNVLSNVNNQTKESK